MGGLLLPGCLFGFDGATLGFDGTTLIEGAVGTDATRTTADEIKTYIEARIAAGG
jgi:hypothetical protein